MWYLPDFDSIPKLDCLTTLGQGTSRHCVLSEINPFTTKFVHFIFASFEHFISIPRYNLHFERENVQGAQGFMEPELLFKEVPLQNNTRRGRVRKCQIASISKMSKHVLNVSIWYVTGESRGPNQHGWMSTKRSLFCLFVCLFVFYKCNSTLSI